MAGQVKSRQRVVDHGEVFTAEREVNAMLDLVKAETERIESRFLEPACGNGNFIAEVLRRKLVVVSSRYRRSPAEYQRYAFVAVSSVYGVDILDSILGDFATPEHLISAKHASFTDLPVYWNIVLGLFMTCANTAIKMMYQSLRDEQAMEELKRQNLQAEMDYLKYQINPHFFMNTLNNIHALIDIDAAYAQDAVIELSKMMRYVLYESGHEAITLEKDIQFMENYIKLMRIRYTNDVDIRVEYPHDLPTQVSIPPLLLIGLLLRIPLVKFNHWYVSKLESTKVIAA